MRYLVNPPNRRRDSQEASENQYLLHKWKIEYLFEKATMRIHLEKPSLYLYRVSTQSGKPILWDIHFGD
jgi:hypothetical protein